jgi:hypothetical protein
MDGNLPGRLARAVAHTYYFKFDDDSERSVAHTVPKTSALGESYDSLEKLRQSADGSEHGRGGDRGFGCGPGGPVTVLRSVLSAPTGRRYFGTASSTGPGWGTHRVVRYSCAPMRPSPH